MSDTAPALPNPAPDLAPNTAPTTAPTAVPHPGPSAGHAGGPTAGPCPAATAAPTCPRLLALGEGAWTVEFGNAIDPALNARVLQLDATLAAARAARHPGLAGVRDVVPSYRSLSVHFDPLATDAAALGAQLLAWADAGALSPDSGRHWLLPVCCDGDDLAPDLPGLARRHGLDPEAVLQRLTGTDFRVYMIGFMPGFPYMGGWPDELATPRLASPRKRVPVRSVAVAGTMCGVYPWDSPGGWNILGRTPLTLFDPAHPEAPAWLAAGDQVRWRRVGRDEAAQIEADLAAGRLQREAFLNPAVPRMARAAPGQAAPPGSGHSAVSSTRTPHGEAAPAAAALASLRVLAGGMGVTVQDGGRHGLRHQGITPAGWMDPPLAAAANALLGNPAEAAGLELRGPGLLLQAEGGPVAVALAHTGPPGPARATRPVAQVLRADGPPEPLPVFTSTVLQPGDRLQVTEPAQGGVACLAVGGGLQLPPQLGSRATHAGARLGGVQGRALAAGDTLPCAPLPPPAQSLRQAPAFAHPDGPIRVLPGPQAEAFSADALAAFFGSPWQATHEQDRMGLRLAGPVLAHAHPGAADIVSDGVATGSIQVPGSGLPIILLADGQTVGGYPKIGTVITADLPRLAHARPGTVLQFQAVNRSEALQALRHAQAHWQAWATRIAPRPAPGGSAAPDLDALYQTSLVSGMVHALDPDLP